MDDNIFLMIYFQLVSYKKINIFIVSLFILNIDEELMQKNAEITRLMQENIKLKDIIKDKDNYIYNFLYLINNFIHCIKETDNKIQLLDNKTQLFDKIVKKL